MRNHQLKGVSCCVNEQVDSVVEVLLVSSMPRVRYSAGPKSRLPRPWHQQKVGSLQLTHQDGVQLLNSELGQIGPEMHPGLPQECASTSLCWRALVETALELTCGPVCSE